MKKFLSIVCLSTLLFSVGACSKEKVEECECDEVTCTVPVIEEEATETFTTIENSIVYIKSSTESDFEVGTGVVIKEDEEFVYLLTNKHVISSVASFYEEYFENIEVRFKDGKSVDATIVGSFNELDVAVLKVLKEDAGKYNIVTINDSAIIGEDVVVYGNPIEIPFVLSKGIISSLSSEVDFSNKGLGLYFGLQTDASVNPGNSGGGLFNMDGELLGIVQGGIVGRNGLGYAIPIKYAMNVANKLISDGEYVPFDYGFYYEDVKTLDYTALGISENVTFGMYITSGEYEGKILKSINGKEIKSYGEMYMYRYEALENNSYIFLNKDGSIYNG